MAPHPPREKGFELLFFLQGCKNKETYILRKKNEISCCGICCAAHLLQKGVGFELSFLLQGKKFFITKKKNPFILEKDPQLFSAIVGFIVLHPSYRRWGWDFKPYSLKKEKYFELVEENLHFLWSSFC